MNKAKPNILNKAGHDPNNRVFAFLLDRLIGAGPMSPASRNFANAIID
jgi:hypothetical protein